MIEKTGIKAMRSKYDNAPYIAILKYGKPIAVLDYSSFPEDFEEDYFSLKFKPVEEKILLWLEDCTNQVEKTLTRKVYEELEEYPEEEMKLFQIAEEVKSNDDPAEIVDLMIEKSEEEILIVLLLTLFGGK